MRTVEGEVEALNNIDYISWWLPWNRGYFNKTMDLVDKNWSWNRPLGSQVGTEKDPCPLWLEFGVFEGHSINLIASRTKNKVYGFDTFTGLPEDWGDHQKEGTYDVEGKLPEVPSNVELIVGLFQDTLEDFLKEHSQPVAYLHMDADLYSSTKYVLDTLKDRIVTGTVISFDEIFGQQIFLDHEMKAWVDFVNENEIEYEWVIRTELEHAVCIIK